MSHPSRTTKTISMKHRRANQISTMAHGAEQNLTTDQIQIQKTEHEVESGRSDQREQHRARADHVAESLLGSKQAVDQPRLAAQLARHPSRGVGDEWERKREHEHPEQPATRVETA